MGTNPEIPRIANLRDQKTIQEQSISLTPSKVSSILSRANDGYNQDQSKLAEEILEKDPEIAAAWSIRQQAFAGKEWSVLPADGKSETDEASEYITDVFKNTSGNMIEQILSFDQMLCAMMNAVIPGFSCARIGWKPGGTAISGFRYLSASHFTFYDSPYMPLLRTEQHREDGEPLPGGPDAWLIHRHFLDGRPISRTGLVRPLAYVFVFKNMNTKDLLRYREKFGIPFLMALIDNMIDQNGTLTAEATAARKALKNFGSDGAAMFSKNIEMSTLDNAGNDGEIFFKCDNMFTKQIAKIILGQTSTQDSENSNRSTAQVHDGVRHDILVADCKAVSMSVRQQLIKPLMAAKYGPDAPLPYFVFNCQVEPDRLVNAQVVQTMSSAGYEAQNLDFIHQQIGNYNFKKKEPIQMNPNNDEGPQNGDDGEDTPVEVKENQ